MKDEEEGFFGEELTGGVIGTPAGAGAGEVGTGWEGDEEIPVLVEEIEAVALVVRAGSFRWQEVGRKGVMAERKEGVSYSPRELTGNQHPHTNDPRKRELETGVVGGGPPASSGVIDFMRLWNPGSCSLCTSTLSPPDHTSVIPLRENELLVKCVHLDT